MGQLGYYTHWQEPEFGLLQLGVRHYDPMLGRFHQIDALALDHVSNWLYALGQPLRITDPTGYYPTLYTGRSCQNGNFQIQRVIAWVNDAMVKYFGDSTKPTVIGAAVQQCNKRIMVQCWNDYCGRSRGMCGFGSPMTDVVQISRHPGCPVLACTLLHEIVHSCGILAHRHQDWNIGGSRSTPLYIPGCGDLAQVQAGDNGGQAN